MSQDNMEKLRAWAAGWHTRSDGVLVDDVTGEAEWGDIDPDVVYEDASLPDHVGEIYRGHDGLMRATKRWAEPFEEMTLKLERIVGSGDCLVSIHRWRAKARHTGIEMEEPLAYVWKFRDGKIIYFRSFRDPDEALRSAGLAD